MINRRTVVLSSTALAAACAWPGALTAGDSEPVLTEDGLHAQPWFLESFLELADDAASAHDGGKRFAVMWELKGCPYCRETHYVNFARDEITSFVRKHFEVLQLNVIGSKIVTDFDGEELSEKALAAKYGVRFTPTIQFFSDDAKVLQSGKPRQREVARLQGYLKPDHFLSMFRYVETRAYDEMNFRTYLKSSSS